MRRTLWIPMMAMMTLLTAGSAAAGEPAGSPGGVATDASPAGDLDAVKNEGERSKRRKTKTAGKRQKRDRDEAREGRGERRRETRSRRARRASRSASRNHSHAHRDARRAYRDHQRRRAYRSSRGHGHHSRVVVVDRRPRHRVLVVAEPDPVVVARAPAAKRPGNGITDSWRHIGGGFGAVWVPEFGAATPAGRFELGAGGYTVGLYGGGGLEVAGSSATPISITGVGYVGMAVPIPVFHPLVGVKVGGGMHYGLDGPGPQVSVGPQAGFIVRPYQGDFGLRVMFDFDVVYKPTKGELAPQAMMTFSGVF